MPAGALEEGTALEERGRVGHLVVAVDGRRTGGVAGGIVMAEDRARQHDGSRRTRLRDRG